MWKTAEILILRHQISVLQRQQPRRPKLDWADRALLATLLGVIPKARCRGLRLLVTLWGSITGSGLGGQPGWDHRWVIVPVVYLLVRRLLGCLMVLARRGVSKDAGTRGGPLGALGKSTLRAAARQLAWYLSTLIGTMYPWR